MASIKYLPPPKFSAEGIKWLAGPKPEYADLNLVLFFEMNEPVCFKLSLPALMGLHARWGLGVGNEADKLKKTFRCFAVSTALGDYEWNNERRTKEWLADGVTKGLTHDEHGSTAQSLLVPPTLCVGADTLVRRSRNRDKLKKEAAALLEAQPWQHDPNMEVAHTLRMLTSYLSSQPYKAVCAEANDVLQHSPSWIIHDKQGNVVFRYQGHCVDVQLRDVLLPYLMGAEKPKPLLTAEYRNAKIEAYRKAAKYPPGTIVGKAVIHHDGVPLAKPAAEVK